MIIRPVLDFIIGKCCSLYVPTSNLSIDEGMPKWKGRLSIRVYNPMKPIKYGIKFYFLCEAKTGYVLDCIIFRGVTSTLRDIVFNLLGHHLGQGYHVFMDNYYTSVSLAEELYENKTHVSGTLRLPRGAPKSLQNKAKPKSLVRGEMVYRRKDNTMVLIWQDIRLVSCVSTENFTHRRRVKRGWRFIYEEVAMQRLKLIREYVNYRGGGGGGGGISLIRSVIMPLRGGCIGGPRIPSSICSSWASSIPITSIVCMGPSERN